MKLTPYGRREWLSGLLIAVCIICIAFCLALLTDLLSWSAFAVIAAVALVVWLAAAAFFRDPERKIVLDPSTILSPADGVVKDIELVKSETLDSKLLRDDLFKNKDVLRIGIFLSVLNVHINRAPVKMKVQFREYKPGAFHDARDGRCAKENEAMLVGAEARCEDGTLYPIAVRQVSGAIARRIVCPVESGDEMEQGYRYGMIKFGSRTEVYLPAGMGFEVAVKVGDTVSAGTSILAHIYPAAQEKLRNSIYNETAAEK